MSEQLSEYSLQEIENKIFTIRGLQVMVDRDLADMYQVETRVLNQAVKRNIDRFPEKFRFQLTVEEMEDLKSQIVTSNSRSQIVTLNKSGTKQGQNIKYLPYAFTEQGVAMLSAVLRSEIAVKVSVQIMDAFVEMRKMIGSHTSLLQRMDRFELKQVDNDKKFEEVFKALESKDQLPEQGVFFNGQTFDAYAFISDLIRSAKDTIQLIDNYVDDSVLTHLDKRDEGVTATIYTKTISKQLKLDLKKHNSQYPEIKVKPFNEAHDRFLIIDEETVYHIGASLKDLGKKWFAFSKMDKESLTIIEKLKTI